MPPKHPHQHPQQHNSGTPYGGGGGGDDRGFDFGTIEKFAHDHAGGSGDSGMFGEAMSMISGRASSIQNQGVDESSMVNAHQSFFGGGNPSGATSGGIGQAAAMQALKMFTGGSGGGGSGGNTKQEFMGMAMGQAAKLYDHQNAQGNVASGSKQSAIQEAGEQALKMYMSSEMGGGGSSGLMGLASKFL